MKDKNKYSHELCQIVDAAYDSILILDTMEHKPCDYVLWREQIRFFIRQVKEELEKIK